MIQDLRKRMEAKVEKMQKMFTKHQKNERTSSNEKYTGAAAKSLQSCLTLCDPMDCSLPGFSVHGILQARTLEWVAIASSYIYGLPSGSEGKTSTHNAGNTGDTGSIPGWGRFPEENGNSFQYSCLKNPMDRRTWLAIVQRVAKSRDMTEQLNNNEPLVPSDEISSKTLLSDQWGSPAAISRPQLC